jgi:YbgC/YbaW family acyl-CoA thioester hydrolase
VSAPPADGVRSARVRVRYADTDQMGVTYHANYLVWFEVGRTDWLRSSGWTYRDMEQAGISLPVIEVFCQYHQPARYDDELEIRTRATLLTRCASGSTTRSSGRPGRQGVGVGPQRPRRREPGGAPLPAARARARDARPATRPTRQSDRLQLRYHGSGPGRLY